MAKAIQPEQFEREIQAFFAWQPEVAKQVQLALDGKQIRGTATPEAGNEYLLGVYVPGADVMLLQVSIAVGQGELTVAPQVLKTLDLQSLPRAWPRGQSRDRRCRVYSTQLVASNCRE